MKSILFLDQNSPFAYDHETLAHQTLGGTEGSVVRIAEKLGERFNVTVAQGKKRTHTASQHVQYVPYSPYLLNVPWHAIIVLRILESAFMVRGALPHVPIWLWIHDLVDIRFLSYIYRLKKNNIGVIAVSDFHKQQLEEMLTIDPYIPAFPDHVRIYNPIDDALVPDQTPVNRRKLFFASSSYKGLYDTLKTFKLLKQKQEDFELFLSNPAYHTTEFDPQEGVINLGPLSHHENIAHMRSSLALFHLNHVVPETFGLVLAEANAVGTPALTHPLGAAPEVLHNKEQLINTYDREDVVRRILSWRFEKRPQVSLPDQFRLSAVIKDWESILPV